MSDPLLDTHQYAVLVFCLLVFFVRPNQNGRFVECTLVVWPLLKSNPNNEER